METTEDTYRALRVDRTGAIAEVTLTGPGKGNAMGPDLWRELPTAFTALESDDAVRAVLLRGLGAHFSYGLDLPAMMGDPAFQLNGELLAAERTRLYDQVLRMQEAFTRVAECRKPVIAAISGWCVGGGLDLAAACDIRLCSAEARFSLREARVAMVADLGSLQRLPAIIGQGQTRELAFTGQDIDAARALRIGLVNDIYESQEALLAAARELAGKIAANPPLVVQGVKRVMNATQGLPIAEGLRHVALWNAAFLPSHDLQEALLAFLERRPPDFQGH